MACRGRRRDRARRRAQAGAGLRVQPVRGGADQRPRRRERGRRPRSPTTCRSRCSLSTDKAVNPVNLYGATKLCAEKIVTQGNAYAGRLAGRASPRCATATSSAAAAASSRSSSARPQEGELTITDEAMTRFWITLEQAVELRDRLPRPDGGRRDLRAQDPEHAGERHRRARWRPDAEREIIGIRPGEKIHEVLITEDESRNASGFDDHYAIYPQFPFWRDEDFARGEELPAGLSLLERDQRRVAGRGRDPRARRGPAPTYS